MSTNSQFNVIILVVRLPDSKVEPCSPYCAQIDHHHDCGLFQRWTNVFQSPDERMADMTEERVVQYLRDNPSVLENYVTGPNVSSETFQKWIHRRNNWNHLRRDARKIFNGAWGVGVGSCTLRALFSHDIFHNEHCIHVALLTFFVWTENQENLGFLLSCVFQILNCRVRTYTLSCFFSSVSCWIFSSLDAYLAPL